MVALLFAACGHRAANGSKTDGSTRGLSASSGEDLPFAVDSIGQEQEDSKVSVQVSVDWPSGTNEALTSSIRRYICEKVANLLNTEGKPYITLYQDGETAVSTTVSKLYNELLSQRTEAESDGAAFDNMQFYYSLHVSLLEETDTYVTYLTKHEVFQGGAHGGASVEGLTFRKTDGESIGYELDMDRETDTFKITGQTLFSDPDSPRLAALIKEGVRSYFQSFDEESLDDDQLRDMLIGVENVDRIPLPNFPPYFTPQGLAFVYQQYEIAPYAAGMVNFTIAYDKVHDLLTADAQELIK